MLSKTDQVLQNMAPDLSIIEYMKYSGFCLLLQFSENEITWKRGSKLHKT